MQQNNTSIGIKSMSKTIFTLHQKLQQETDNNNTQLLESITQEIKEFLIKKQLQIRNHQRLTQIYKIIEDQTFSITIFPRNKEKIPPPKLSLPLQELDKFDEYFSYAKLQSKALKFDEEERRQEIIDDRLDQLNPLGLDLVAPQPVQTFITIRPNKFDNLICISMVIGMGNIEFRELGLLENVQLQTDWHQQFITTLEQFSESFKTQILDLSDPLQASLLNYLIAFDLEPKDAYYFELIAILSEQTNYVQWMKGIHDIMLKNSLHS